MIKLAKMKAFPDNFFYNSSHVPLKTRSGLIRTVGFPKNIGKRENRWYIGL